jgi:DNA-binding response OmpR family regulator
MDKKILLVDDSPDIRMLVEAILGSDYQLTVAESVNVAREKLKTDIPHLILLDVQLPDGDGFHFCSELKNLKETSLIPVLFLTGSVKPQDKVLGFSVGADDYITKPLEPLEFLARVKAKFRQLEHTKESETNLVKGNFRINTAKQKISVRKPNGEIALELTTNEFKLLLHFLRHEEEVFSRNQLLDEIWGTETHVTDRTVDTHIYSIRKKLGEYSHLIQAVPRVGYKFSQAV